MSDTVIKKKVLPRKLTEEMKKKLREEEYEKMLIKREEERKKLEEDEKIKFKKRQEEQKIRLIKLQDSCSLLNQREDLMFSSEVADRNTGDWRSFIKCENFRVVPWVNEYISIWKEMENLTILQVKEKLPECISIMSALENFIENPLQISNTSNYIECQRLLRNEIYSKFDKATYLLLRNVEIEMDSIDLETSKFNQGNEYFNLNLWTHLDRPRPSREEKIFTSCQFENVTIQLPKNLSHLSLAVRSFWLKYDYFSEECRTWKCASLPDDYYQNIIMYVTRDWNRRQVLRKKQMDEDFRIQSEKDKRKRILKKIKYLIPSKIPTPPLDGEGEPTEKDAEEGAKTQQEEKFLTIRRTPSQIIDDEEQGDLEVVKSALKFDVHKNEVNLRKFHIIGGMFNLNILKQPAQPILLKGGATLTVLTGVHNLQHWDYSETYEYTTIAPQTSQSTDDDEENENEGKLLTKLVLISIKLSEHVLWLDIPFPVKWDENKHYWSTEYIYEVKYNEEKQLITFRSGKLGIMGLAIFRWCNIPFQTWEIKPETKSNQKQSGTVLTITAAIVIVEFLIRKNRVCLSQLQGGATNALQHLIGIFHKPRDLIKKMKNGGIDLFPENDTYLYVENAPKKHRITEHHLYHCMSLFVNRYCYSWSRWNLAAGYKKFVLQLRNVNDEDDTNILLVTPHKALIVNCTEVSASFSDIGIPGMEFHPDLYHLILNGLSKNESPNFPDPLFSETVYFMLCQTRLLSFS